MSDSKSVKMHYDVAGDDFDRAGEAAAGEAGNEHLVQTAG